MSGLWGRHKRTSDPESGYYTTHGETVQIGKISIRSSYFNILCLNKGSTIEFTIGFLPDAMKWARFTAAKFHVDFRDKFGNHVKIVDMSPTDLRGAPVNVHHTATLDTSVKSSFGYSGASTSVTADKKATETWDEDTFSQVRGSGVHTSAADWTFAENNVKGGLDVKYNLSVQLAPETVGEVTMRFWAAAGLKSWGMVLVEQMDIGSYRHPNVRRLLMMHE